jgi:DNA ligase (NAD+)
MNERMIELVALLNQAGKMYYGGDGSLMTDFEYDRLYDELAELERVTGIVAEDSPTRNVGFAVADGLAKVRHEVPMLSLDKTKDISKLEAFLGDRAGLLSVKYDGLSLAVRYENGRLAQAVTRGNGEVGEDVTVNALTFKNLPREIGYKGKLTVRGEAVISFSEFERINLREATEYKNPRNLVSGSVRQLDSGVCAKRNVEFFAFGIVSSDLEINSKKDRLIWLSDFGIGHAIVCEADKRNIAEKVEYMRKLAAGCDYATDGLVLTYDDAGYSESLGVTSKFPRDSVAFKWADETYETVLKEIEWSVSRTGLINPVAVFEPVEIEGSTVERASLHNVSIYEGLGLAAGDRVTVYKANMIIPQIADNLTRVEGRQVAAPAKCPVCDFDTELRENNGVKTLYCVNNDCGAQVVRRIAHYASRDALNIEGLSVQTIEAFIENGILRDFTDLYKLSEHEDKIKGLRGFGEKSYNGLVKAVEKSREVKTANFIYGLGINHVGLANAKLLCEYFDDDFGRIKAAGKEELMGIAGFGEKIADAAVSFFSDAKNMEQAETAYGYLIIEEAAKVGGAFTGKVFVITGETAVFKNRRDLTAFIVENGGKVTESVSAKTDYLVNNDAESGSSKNKKAKSLGVRIIGEAELMGLADL